jgi:hypothetical protein
VLGLSTKRRARRTVLCRRAISSVRTRVDMLRAAPPGLLDCLAVATGGSRAGDGGVLAPDGVSLGGDGTPEEWRSRMARRKSLPLRRSEYGSACCGEGGATSDVGARGRGCCKESDAFADAVWRRVGLQLPDGDRDRGNLRLHAHNTALKAPADIRRG